MKTGLRVGDIMTRNFVKATEDLNLRDCARMMIKKRVGSILICEEDNRLKGIITEKDIVWALVKTSRKDLRDISARAVMKRRVITIKPSADLEEALRLFKKKKVRRLPVVEGKKVIGIITQNDILKIDPGLFEILAQGIKIREEAEKLKIVESSNKGSCEECGEFTVLYLDGVQYICKECFDKR